MKKNFFRFALLLMATAMVAFACKKNPTPSGKTDDGSKDPTTTSADPADPSAEPGGDTGKNIEITLDGQFDDWKAITEETVKSNEYVGIVKGADDDAIRVIKAASDADNLYFYAEILIEALPQTSICEEWGDSNNGVEHRKGDEENDTVPEDPTPFNLFIDPDGDASTGFFTYAGDDGETPAIPGLGCEMCAQNLFFFNPTTSKLGVAWNQTNIGPTKVGNVGEDGLSVDAAGYTGDYNYNGTIFQTWPDSGDQAAFPLWGWQNWDNSGAGDNVAPRPENIVATTDGDYVIVEFAIEKSEIVNLPDDATGYAWGVCFRFGDYIQDIGPISASYVE